MRRIVTSSLLATACVLQEALNCGRLWNTAELEARAAHLRFVMAEVNLALTFCRSASLLSNHSALRVLSTAQTAFQHASRFLELHQSDDRELQ